MARAAGIEHVYAEQTPEGKLDVVRAVRARDGLRNVVMVGDGINDAPALALADVGIAMAGKGATISSETADVVITVDDANRIALSLQIGRRSLRIARESVILGLGLSAGAMLVAALGLPPAGLGRALPGGRRRDGDPQRAARPPRLEAAAGERVRGSAFAPMPLDPRRRDDRSQIKSEGDTR